MASKTPKFPVNVRVRHEDDSYTPVECVFTGQDGDGQNVWTSVRPVLPGQLEWDEMPENTTVLVSVS